MTLEVRQFNFLSVLTALVVLAYVGASVYAMVQRIITWQDFTGSVGTVAGLLIGYWLKDSK